MTIPDITIKSTSVANATAGIAKNARGNLKKGTI
jgi:hypothetical protein